MGIMVFVLGSDLDLLDSGDGFVQGRSARFWGRFCLGRPSMGSSGLDPWLQSFRDWFIMIM
uniref:Uncharacterized protein n=1 Tax=Kalanchoe fedtschenkoi TaxID=63787 RepID=A0A7N0UVL5_KALFE